MGLNLRKGEGLNLKKADGTALTQIAIALGWKRNGFDTGAKFDPDVTLFVCGDNEKDGWPQVIGQEWCICYAQPKSPNGEIVHSGDDQVGGDGQQDNETILVNLPALPANATNLNAVITIHDAKKRNQNFGQMDKVYARILDMTNGGAEIARYTLNEGEGALSTAMLITKIYKDSSGAWTIKALGNGFENGLGDFCRCYGVQVDSE